MLLSKVAVRTAERYEWYDFVSKAMEKLKMAELFVALELTLREVALQEIVAHTEETAELQEQIASKGSELL